MVPDPYSVLGLTWGASPASIRAAFRKLARLHHPDRNPGDPGAEARFKLISADYHRLEKAGWSLPQPSQASSFTHDSVDAEPDFIWPTHWADGTPIHYPSPEDIASLRRGTARSVVLPRLRAAERWLTTGFVYVVVVVFAATVVGVVFMLLFGLVKLLSATDW